MPKSKKRITGKVRSNPGLTRYGSKGLQIDWGRRGSSHRVKKLRKK